MFQGNFFPANRRTTLIEYFHEKSKHKRVCNQGRGALSV